MFYAIGWVCFVYAAFLAILSIIAIIFAIGESYEVEQIRYAEIAKLFFVHALIAAITGKFFIS